MKRIKYIFSMVFVLGLLFSACSENDPDINNFPSDKVAFTYAAEGAYPLDYFIGSTIAFTNTSTETGTYSWDFGDGLGSSTAQSPTYIFEEPGSYDVTLTIDGVGKTTKRITVSDLIPLVDFASTDSIPVIKSSIITLSAFVPNPKDLLVTYDWSFPEGTIDENGNPIRKSDQEDPGKLTFNNVGSQQIVLKTTVGSRVLEEVIVNAQVGYNTPVKTVYYAVKGGNMMAYKIIDQLPADVKNRPFNLGLKSGQHPLNLIFKDSLLYVFDAGRQFTFVDDVTESLGDGRITAVSKDGQKVDVVVDNNAGKAFDDPFFGCIVDSTLYYSDRNTGVTAMALKDRNASGARGTNYWIKNESLGYYHESKSLVYGAINGNMAYTSKDKTWWWCKTFGSFGIFRFKAGDIGAKVDPTDPATGIILSGEPVKSLAIDSDRGILYVAVVDKGFYKIELSKLKASFPAQKDANGNSVKGTLLSEFTLIKTLLTDEVGTASERAYISQLTLDPEDGCVYFGYRAGQGSTEKSGLKRYNPNGNKFETLIENVEIYGVGLNIKKTKLF